MTTEQSVPVLASQSQPGETLRKAREGRGMALNDVAVALNLSPTALKNLESGAFDRLPGHTFARGYVRAYAKLLGMDQALLVREFDQATGTDAMGSSVNSLGRIDEPVRVSHGLLRMVSLGVLAVLVLAGFLWWQDGAKTREESAFSNSIQQVEVESADGTTQVHPLEPEDQAVELAQQDGIVLIEPIAPVVQETPANAGEPAADAAVSPEAAAAAVQPTSDATAVAEVSTNSEPVAAVAESTSQPALAAGEGLLSIHFIANCWTQISDGNGKVLISALRRPGEDIQLAVKLPLELRLGYVSGAQVTFNGKRVDMQPFTTGETARLKLGQ